MTIAVTTNETAVQVTATSGPLVSVAVTNAPATVLATALVQGPVGAQGEAGPEGAASTVPGPKGDTGDTGAQGVPGPKGDTGDTGAQGIQGVPGPKGDTGDTGDTGAQGVPGPKGAQGPPGSDSPLGEAPEDGKQYARKDGAWEEITGGPGGVTMATFETTLDFGRGGMSATAVIADPTMTDSKIITPFYTSSLDEVAVLGMRVVERSRTVGVGFEVIGVAPSGAFGTYNIRTTTLGD